MAKLLQLQLYGNTIVVIESATVADRTATITTVRKPGFITVIFLHNIKQEILANTGGQDVTFQSL